MTTTRAILLGCLLCIGMMSCSPPADPISSGRICAPERADCPSKSTVMRTTPFGRNAIDFVVTNNSSAPVKVTVLAGPAELFVEDNMSDMGDMADMGNVPNLDLFEFLGVREYEAVPGNTTIQDRFIPSELGRSSEITMQAYCPEDPSIAACNISLDFVVIVEANECSANEDCDGNWICDTTRGECVECVAGGDQCATGQSCELGRCQPERVSSCAQTQGQSPSWPLWILFGLTIFWRTTRRRRRILPLAALLLVLCTSSTGWAEPPRARVHLGVGPRYLTGQMGELTNFGLGFSLGQEMRGQHFGVGVTLNATYFTTTQPPPPTSRSLIIYSAQLMPALYYPLGDFEIFAKGGYERVGLAANSLIRITGEDLSYHGASVGAGAQWVLNPLEIRLGGTWHWISGLPGQMITIELSIGFGAQKTSQ